MNKIKIPKGWVFKYFQVEDGITKFVYEDNLGIEHIYINKEIEQDTPSEELINCSKEYLIKQLEYSYKEIERLNNTIDKAIEYIEYYFVKGRTKNHKQFDLSLYEILTGKNLFNLTMKEIEQYFKGVDKE